MGGGIVNMLTTLKLKGIDNNLKVGSSRRKLLSFDSDVLQREKEISLHTGY